MDTELNYKEGNIETYRKKTYIACNGRILLKKKDMIVLSYG